MSILYVNYSSIKLKKKDNREEFTRVVIEPGKCNIMKGMRL